MENVTPRVGHNLNKLGKGPLDDAPYQISMLLALWFQTRRFLNFPLYIHRKNWPRPMHFVTCQIAKLQGLDKPVQIHRFIGLHCSYTHRNRGSYMSAPVLLNLLNKLGKMDKMRGLPSILSLFRNLFNKFNNTRA